MFEVGDILEYKGNPAYPAAHQAYKGSLFILANLGAIQDNGLYLLTRRLHWTGGPDGMQVEHYIRWVCPMGGADKRLYRININDLRKVGHVEE